MAIAEDVRNLFREFDGRAESYIEFDPGRRSASPDGNAPVDLPGANGARGPAPVNGRGHAASPPERSHTPPAQAPALDAVFARLAGRAG